MIQELCISTVEFPGIDPDCNGVRISLAKKNLNRNLKTILSINLSILPRREMADNLIAKMTHPL